MGFETGEIPAGTVQIFFHVGRNRKCLFSTFSHFLVRLVESYFQARPRALFTLQSFVFFLKSFALRCLFEQRNFFVKK